MNSRDLVIRHVTECMIDAFTKGDVIDARNLEAFLGTLEAMSDVNYTTFITEAEAEQSGAIS